MGYKGGPHVLTAEATPLGDDLLQACLDGAPPRPCRDCWSLAPDGSSNSHASAQPQT